MSKILCIIDGINDSSFNAEKYPALASFPARSYIKTVPDGFEAETLPCVLSLLGITLPPMGGYKNLLIIPGYASHVNSINAILPFELLGKHIDKGCESDIPLKWLPTTVLTR